MITRRIKGRKKLVYQKDEALIDIEDTKLERYFETLDTSHLDLNELAPSAKPTVFHCDMLKVKFEHLADGAEIDYWGIFATHVKQIENFDVELKFSDKYPDFVCESMRDEIPPDVYKDIAQQIVILARRGDSTVFFSKPVDWWGFKSGVLNRRASKGIALLAGATAKKSE